MTPLDLLMFSQNTCIDEKPKDLKAQLDSSSTFRVMDLSGLPKNPLKMQNLRWNNSNLIMNWETILTLNNYMGEMNSEIISTFQVPRPN